MSEKVVSLLRPEIARLKGYQMTPPAESSGQKTEPACVVKLDSNENPYGSAPAVAEVLSKAAIWHRYPDPLYADARRALSKYCGAPMERIVLGNGSDELIDLLVRAFVAPGDEVIICPPTFDMYQVYTEVMGGSLINIPRREDFGLDLEVVLEKIGARAKLVFLASPNSPTGNTADLESVVRLAEVAPLLILDEAYAEFAGQNYIPVALERDNVIVLRSLSKWAGLAGLRIGYGVFPPGVVPYLNSLRSPYNVNQAAQLAVQATLANVDVALGRVRQQIEERERLHAALSQIPYLRPYPSQTNFIFTEVVGRDALALQEALARQGVVVRGYSQPSLRRYLRVGVGTADDNDALLAAIRRC